MTRRRFLGCSLSLGALVSGPLAYGAETSKPRLRAVIIGSTGHGNYGHDHDLIFNGRPEIEVLAVADPDAGGRAKAIARSGALRGYADYREMLEKEKPPNLVCIAPRCTNEHHAMALAALQAGAHVYLEKPITRTLAEADELLALAKSKGLRIAVAHQIRLAPNILLLKKCIDDGLIGELLEMRAHGKQDHRAGGEDLIVLGVHLFDLMRFFAGDAAWCSARVLQNGHEVTPQDAHAATEDIGPIAGDDIVAQFSFAKRVSGSFVSRGKYREAAGPWGIELIGSTGSVRIRTEMIPKIYTLARTRRDADPENGIWEVWKADPTLSFPESERSMSAANRRVVDDWLEAIIEERDPVCSGYAGTKALEMALAVFAAGLSRGRVDLPLRNREHPLGQ